MKDIIFKELVLRAIKIFLRYLSSKDDASRYVKSDINWLINRIDDNLNDIRREKDNQET